MLVTVKIGVALELPMLVITVVHRHQSWLGVYVAFGSSYEIFLYHRRLVIKEEASRVSSSSVISFACSQSATEIYLPSLAATKTLVINSQSCFGTWTTQANNSKDNCSGLMLKFLLDDL